MATEEREQVDHRAEAQGCLEWLGTDDITQGTTADPRVPVALGVAQVHATLAVEEALGEVAHQLEELVQRLTHA
jgi:hypothetical protein